ncbi:cation diffusion facilitator family transporter [Paenibacillus sp. UNC499MF]|uniref:cation diffusion facilitator family transporter n=1 Tax=Paenibacillus sp. UNC499MF TaxID=1502751 RepID=UPI00089FB3CD|nr:cation diffusion facilitator family transporter [Paenibacillus sp. UNC499MF]SEF42432.1 cation diffusion facilitator family transporter [Paenibacillus sp. UNC499MF]
MSDERFQKAEVAAWIGIGGNIGLTVLKGVVGVMAGSRSLLADAVHSASDTAGSFASLRCLKAPGTPVDHGRSYGRDKAESIAAILIAVILTIISVEISMNAVKDMVSGVHNAPESYALIAVIVSLVCKEVMFRYNYWVGKKLGSRDLVTGTWEHRSGVYSSIMTLAGVGGALIGDKMGWAFMYYLDPAAAVAVTLLIVKNSYGVITDALQKTMDRALHQEDARDMIDAVQGVKGVISVEDLRAREHGHYVIVELRISVNPRISVLEGNDIARSVKYQLMKKFIHLSDVTIHVFPYDSGYPYKQGIDAPAADNAQMLH